MTPAVITEKQLSSISTKEVGDKEAAERAYWNLGGAYSSLYDFPKTIEFYQKNVSIAKEIGNKKSQAMGYIKLTSSSL